MSKFLGLMGKKSLDPDSGLLLKNCGSIHCFFMRFTIDVIYLSSAYEVLYTETVKPWRLGRIVRHTKHTLELPEGSKDRFTVGKKVEFLIGGES